MNNRNHDYTHDLSWSASISLKDQNITTYPIPTRSQTLMARFQDKGVSIIEIIGCGARCTIHREDEGGGEKGRVAWGGACTPLVSPPGNSFIVGFSWATDAGPTSRVIRTAIFHHGLCRILRSGAQLLDPLSTISINYQNNVRSAPRINVRRDEEERRRVRGERV